MKAKRDTYLLARADFLRTHSARDFLAHAQLLLRTIFWRATFWRAHFIRARFLVSVCELVSVLMVGGIHV